MNMEIRNCVVNGAEILDRKYTGRQSIHRWVVLCYWLPERYVTWICTNDGHTFHGHYFDDYTSALSDFNKRN